MPINLRQPRDAIQERRGTQSGSNIMISIHCYANPESKAF